MPEQENHIKGGVHQAVVHDSAEGHVSGQAVYVDDMPEPRDLLHAYIGVSERPHAKIGKLDLAAVGAAEGVYCVVSASDITGQNDISPTHTMDEPVFAETVVEFVGQPLFPKKLRVLLENLCNANTVRPETTLSNPKCAFVERL